MAANRGFNNPAVQKAATANAHTPAALAKQAATRHANALVKSEIYTNLKNALLSPNRNGKLYCTDFIDKFLAEARKDPGGRCGQTVANVIFQQDILTLLDAEQEKNMARDLDFMRYRAIKRLFREQRDLVLDYDKRKKTVFCSRRAGKTDSNSTNLVYTCVTPNSPCLYINKTYRNAIDQMWDLAKDQAEAIGLLTDDGTSKSDGMMVFSNGSSIKFSGNDNIAAADKLRGGKYRLIIIDEAGHQANMKYLITEVLEPTLADFPDSQLILTGTPPRIPHTYAEVCYNNPEWTHYHWTAKVNPFIHDFEGMVDSICKEKGVTRDSPFIKREYEGMMGYYDTEAQVFKGRHTREKYCDKDEDIHNHLDFKPTNICIGVDFGFSDYNSVVTLVYNKTTREARVIMESKFNRSTITAIVEEIKRQYDIAQGIALKNNINLATVEVFCDCNERSIVSELVRNYKINAHTCWKYDKAMAIEQLAEELRTGRMQIYKGSALDDEMDQILYKRDENDNILSEIDEDLGVHPELAMSLLYASRQMFLDYGYDTGGRSKEAQGKER